VLLSLLVMVIVWFFSILYTPGLLSLDSKFTMLFLCGYEFAQWFLVISVLWIFCSYTYLSCYVGGGVVC